MHEPNGERAIAVHGLQKSFGNQKVLDGVNLEVERGKTLVILGRSGTGKSVLLRLLVRLERPDAGDIQLLGSAIGDLAINDLNEVRKKVGFVFQHAALYDSLTVEQNVAFPLEHHSRLGPAERRDRVRALLERVGMSDALGKLPAQISGGMRKRVGLARALALDPAVILYDEPTAGLDPITSGEIDDLIREVQSEHDASSIVVTHEMHSARTIADRVALLAAGRVAFEGTFDELRGSDDPFIAQFVRAGSDS
jgi:phospholipid/cholesterol/gamma-HCH transport system ATP-binding protein